jgi:hypothetical protein
VIKARVAVAGILLLMGFSANAVPPTLLLPVATARLTTVGVQAADAVARAALEAKDYPKVLSAYEPFLRDDLSAAAFYRMAIAHQKMGNGGAASQALESALNLNPLGTFASSPARLEALRNDIAKMPIPEAPVIQATPVELPVPIAVEAPALPVIRPIGLPYSEVETPSSKTEPVQKVLFEATSKSTNKGLGFDASEMAPIEAMVFGASAMLFVLGCIMFLVGVVKSLFNPKRAIPAVQMSTVISQLTQLRATGDELLANLTAAGQRDTILYEHLARLLPHVERELGRGAKVEVQLSDKDKEGFSTLIKTPLKLSSASAEQITQLFQNGSQ